MKKLKNLWIAPLLLLIACLALAAWDVPGPVSAFSLIHQAGGGGGEEPGSEGVARTGDIIELNSNANSGSTSVTVPTDATLIVVAVSGYYGVTGDHPVGAGSLTLGAESLTRNYNGANNPGMQHVAFFSRRSPLTGSRTLAWDWDGASAPSEGLNINVAFYKGVAESDFIVSSGGAQANSTAQKTTGSMSASSGNMVVCVGDTYTGGALTWSANVSKQADGTYNGNYFEFVEGEPAAAITVTMSSTDEFNVLGCIVIGD